MTTHTRSGRTVKTPKRYGYDEEDTINIYFKTLTGKTHEISINKNQKIGHLCDKYSELFNNSKCWEMYILIHNNNRLNIVGNIFKKIKTRISHNDNIHVVMNYSSPQTKENSIRYSYETWKRMQLHGNNNIYYKYNHHGILVRCRGV